MNRLKFKSVRSVLNCSNSHGFVLVARKVRFVQLKSKGLVLTKGEHKIAIMPKFGYPILNLASQQRPPPLTTTNAVYLGGVPPPKNY